VFGDTIHSDLCNERAERPHVRGVKRGAAHRAFGVARERVDGTWGWSDANRLSKGIYLCQSPTGNVETLLQRVRLPAAYCSRARIRTTRRARCSACARLSAPSQIGRGIDRIK
jgi:hypothetical protein